MTAVADPVVPKPPASSRPTTLSEIEPEPSSGLDRFLVGLFVVVPLLAVAAVIPIAWGWGLGWHDIVIAAVFYVFSGMGISMGFHRHFTHLSFRANNPLRIVMGIAGSMAIEGPVLTWVADHRRHHKYSDKEGDPHSPWRFGNDWRALRKGFMYAHMGWLFDPNRTSQQKFCPDLLADRPIRRVSKTFPLWVAVSRMYRGMHHPLDVAGGVIVGISAIAVLLFACRAAGCAQRSPAVGRSRARVSRARAA